MKKTHSMTRVRRLAGLGLALVALGGAGCATVRRAREAQAGRAIPVGERTATAAELGLGTNTVLTLDTAVAIGLRCRPSVAQGRQNLAAAEAQVRQARSAWQPSVRADAGYSRRTSNVQVGGGGSGATGAYSASLGADLLICDFGKTPAVVRQAVEQRMAAEESLRSARNDVTHEIRSAFFELRKAQELQRVQEEAVRQYQSHLEQVKAFAAAGKRIRYDVTKAEVDVGNAQLNLIDARNAVAVARASLNQGLGLTEEPGYRTGGGTLPEIAGDEGHLLDLARKRHPELLALRARERAASASVDASVAELYPSLSLSGSYTAGGRHFPLVWNWSAAAQAVLQVFDGGRRLAAIDEVVTRLGVARANFADREQQLSLELRRALAARDTARQREDVTTLIVRQAGESLVLVKERYRLGKASSVEVTDAQVAQTQAQADRVKAHFEYQAALARIAYTIGEEQP